MREYCDMKTRIIVAGGRSFQDYDLLKESLDMIVLQYENVEIVSGHAKGADAMGEQYAKEHGLPCSVFPAEWSKYGKRADFIRNSQMLEYAAKEKPMVVAFWNGSSTGTKDTLDKAEQMGITRYVFSYNEKDILNEKRPMKIWLDDIRPAPEGYYHCHSVGEAKRNILKCEENGRMIDVIDCDHDLGVFVKDGGDGICLLDWLAERKRFYKITLHSMNPVGRANMDRLLKRFWDKWDDYNGEMLGTKIPEVLREATVYYEDLLYSEQGKETLRFLKEKGLTDETIRKFHLGYAPKEKDIFYRYMSGKGWPDAGLFSSGLCTFYDRIPADRFQDRILFPVMNEEGQTVTFCGRAMGGEGPVYLNATIPFCFDKKSVIYGLYPVNESGKTELILCEGYLDVILLHQEGFTNAVSNPWSSLTKEQAAVLKRYADSVILSYDSDEAGKRGAARAARLLKEAGLMVKKLDVSPYRDPYELLRKGGKKEYAHRLEEAETL